VKIGLASQMNICPISTTGQSPFKILLLGMEIPNKIKAFDYLIKPLLIIVAGLLLLLINRRKFRTKKGNVEVER
jgi:hypothetical protein